MGYKDALDIANDAGCVTIVGQSHVQNFLTEVRVVNGECLCWIFHNSAPNQRGTIICRCSILTNMVKSIPLLPRFVFGWPLSFLFRFLLGCTKTMVSTFGICIPFFI